VDHLLDATRLESGSLQLSREWCSPGELLREAIEVARLAQAVNVFIAPDLPEILADARLLQQALVSLLANADAYGAPEKPIQARAVQHGSDIVFSVADRGPGLAAGEETKVFRKFYRGPGKPAGGLGLGLSIARHLVEAHGGIIIAQNREDGGARFTIRIPVGAKMQMPAEPYPA
jgi:two-component system sensor histidine kinase KdpD